MHAELDLHELALERPTPARTPSGPRRHLWSRYAIPWGILAGFVGLLGWAARDVIQRPVAVKVVPVVVAEAGVEPQNAPLFHAAGWVEPRPTAIHVPAMAPGIVDRLLVVEGQEVQKGEPVATLIDIDARLSVRKAEAALALRKAELEAAQAELRGAKLRLEQPVHLEAALAEAESALARAQAELAAFPQALASSAARLEFARQKVEGRRSAGAAIAERLRQEAESELAAAQAARAELERREPLLRKEVESLQRRREAVAQRLTLRIDERQGFEDAKARVQAAQARRDQAQLELEQAQLNLERTVVRAPASGRVLQLVARPGTQIAGQGQGSAPATVVTMYDPGRLQVRVDVPLENVPRVQPGQPVVVETASAGHPLRGVVLQSTSAANIQKNTLEVKVAIEEPPETIRPDMLVSATFLSLAPPGAAAEVKTTQRLLVPKVLVESSDGNAAIWIVDPRGRARRQAIQLGPAGSDDLVEVIRGLSPTDKLLADRPSDLREGDRVAITGEDTHLGRNRQTL